jgi:4-diphosphocytidyl-2-C-methyl-D-erythritol kinase
MPAPTLARVARAPAKVNLALHVTGRRADGYHDLDSLVAFAGTGDTLALEPDDVTSLSVTGPTAGAAGPDADNLVLKAVALLRDAVPGLQAGRFHLVKRLPVAAGIGGGSSDAAAALRLVATLNGLDPADPRVRAAARATGADVPVCLFPCARLMQGAGETVGPPLRLPPLFAVLVNPGVPVPTPPVFASLGLARGQAFGTPLPPLPPAPGREALLAWLKATRNDLQPPAVSVAPVVAEVVAALDATPGCRLARMSGSGATCFGLYDDCAAAAAAARLVRAGAPHWWVRSTLLR